LNWDFIIPSFFKEDKFKINTDLINNDDTIKFIKSSDKIEYVFKSILSSFNKQKKKPVGVFDDVTLKLFNNTVDKIDRIIDKALMINREYELQKGDLKNFKDYFDLQYNTDSTGAQYFPDMYDEFDDGDNKKKKKKGKMVQKKKGQDVFGSDDDFEDFNPKKEEL
jgi:predicted oxidoreductase (fatty acid repression mutant protein)